MDCHTPASEIIKKLRGFAGPTNPKKMKYKTLPMVCNAEDQVCQYPAEALQVGIDFFMNMVVAGELRTRISEHNGSLICENLPTQS